MKENKKNKALTIALILGMVLLTIDQISKMIVIQNDINRVMLEHVLSFRLVRNNGIAFGIGQGTNVATFIISNLIVLGIIIRFIWLQKERMDTSTMYGLFLVLAGGIGNFIDRVLRGKVIDFIEVFPETHFPVFNLADIYIVIRLDYTCIFVCYVYI